MTMEAPDLQLFGGMMHFGDMPSDYSSSPAGPDALPNTPEYISPVITHPMHTYPTIYSGEEPSSPLTSPAAEFSSSASDGSEIWCYETLDQMNVKNQVNHEESDMSYLTGVFVGNSGSVVSNEGQWASVSPVPSYIPHHQYHQHPMHHHQPQEVDQHQHSDFDRMLFPNGSHHAMLGAYLPTPNYERASYFTTRSPPASECQSSSSSSQSPTPESEPRQLQTPPPSPNSGNSKVVDDKVKVEDCAQDSIIPSSVASFIHSPTSSASEDSDASSSLSHLSIDVKAPRKSTIKATQAKAKALRGIPADQLFVMENAFTPARPQQGLPPPIVTSNIMCHAPSSAPCGPSSPLHHDHTSRPSSLALSNLAAVYNDRLLPATLPTTIAPVRSSSNRTTNSLHPKPFHCEMCPASFSRKHDLKRHTRIHLGIRPFKCPACGKVFSRHDALNRHVVKWGCDKKLEALAAGAGHPYFMQQHHAMNMHYGMPMMSPTTPASAAESYQFGPIPY